MIENNWRENEIELLKQVYGKYTKLEISKMMDYRHSESSIQTKANRIGLRTREYWTEEEVSFLKNNYSSMHMEDIMLKLPTRSRHSIIGMAQKLKIYGKRIWEDWEKQYIIDNWELTPDFEMANFLQRSQRSVKWEREELKLYRQNKEDKNYARLDSFFRRHTNEWKRKSAENCNYQCVFTNSKNFEIHHIYSVSLIMKDLFDKYPLMKKVNFKDYSKEELDFLLSEFLEMQNEHLGVCVSKEIHKLFHSLYGLGYNTIKQWDRFKEDMENGKYTDLLN